MINVTVTPINGNDIVFHCENVAEMCNTLNALREGKYLLLEYGISYIPPSAIQEIDVVFDESDPDYLDDMQNIALFIKGVIC